MPTQILITVSNICRQWWYVVFLGEIAAVWAFRRWINSEEGRKRWDTISPSLTSDGPPSTLRLPKKIPSRFLCKSTASYGQRSPFPLARMPETISSMIDCGFSVLGLSEVTYTASAR